MGSAQACHKRIARVPKQHPQKPEKSLPQLSKPCVNLLVPPVKDAKAPTPAFRLSAVPEYRLPPAPAGYPGYRYHLKLLHPLCSPLCPGCCQSAPSVPELGTPTDASAYSLFRISSKLFFPPVAPLHPPYRDNSLITENNKLYQYRYCRSSAYIKLASIWSVPCYNICAFKLFVLLALF